VLALHVALERKGSLRTYAACFALAAVVLTNWLGGFALAMAIASYLLARSDDPLWLGIVTRAAGIGVLAYALASSWIPPSTIGDIQRNAQYVIGRYPMGMQHIAYFAGLLVVAAGWRLVLRRLKAPLCLRFSAYFATIMCSIVLTAEWTGRYLVPQPERYHLEMEMALCLVVVFGLGSYAYPRVASLKTWVLAAVLLLASVQLWNYSTFAGGLIRPIDMTRTVEYQAGTWLDRNLPHQRVYAIGSTQFWLNAFAGNAQIGGGFGQGVVNPQVPVVHYGLSFTEGDGSIGAMWLRLFGAKAVVVSGPEGRDAYRHGWRDPSKFQGVLPELWRQGDDVIYGVPQRSASLAHVILRQHVAGRSPINNLDVDPVRRLDAALLDSSLPVADLTWERPNRATIRSTLSPEHLVFVQVSYHPGWRATVDDEPRPIARDGLGFMVIEPRCQGPCEVQLVFDGGIEMRLANLAGGAAILGGLGWFWWERRRRRARNQTARPAEGTEPVEKQWPQP
jgi:hypothetical protein